LKTLGFLLVGTIFAAFHPNNTIIKGLNMLNKLRLLTLAVLFHATSSWAMPMDYTFEVDFTSGALFGTSAPVSVTLSGVTNVGEERCSADEFDSFSDCLVEAFDFTFGTDTFSKWDAVTAGNVTVYLSDGTFGGAGFRTGLFNNGEPGVNMTGHSVIYRDTNSLESAGVVDLSSWAKVPAQVPAPATLVLFGLGLVGLGISRRKRKTHS
jgi:hypothetical protein